MELEGGGRLKHGGRAATGILRHIHSTQGSHGNLEFHFPELESREVEVWSSKVMENDVSFFRDKKKMVKTYQKLKMISKKMLKLRSWKTWRTQWKFKSSELKI